MHMKGVKRELVLKMLKKSFQQDTFYLQYQNLDFILREFLECTEVKQRARASQFRDVLTEYYLAYQLL